MSVTLYYIEDYGRKSMICALEHMEEGATSNNLARVIMKAVSDLSGMSREDIATRFLAFGAVDVFQGYKTSVIWQMQESSTPSGYSLFYKFFFFQFHIVCFK